MTWKNVDGVFMVYYEGRLVKTGTGFKTGQLVPSEGIFTLGIGPQGQMSYTGRLSHVNAWSSVLDHPQLAVLSSKCGVQRGELVSWPEFKHGIYSGSALEGASCNFTGKFEQNP